MQSQLPMRPCVVCGSPFVPKYKRWGECCNLSCRAKVVNERRKPFYGNWWETEDGTAKAAAEMVKPILKAINFEDRTCKMCREPFRVKYKRSNQKTCSDECARRNNTQLQEQWRESNISLTQRTCSVCGKSYTNRDATTLAACSATECQKEYRRNMNRNAKHSRRELVKRNREGTVYRREVYERDNWTCGICGQPIDKTLPHTDEMSVSLDHKLALSLGGKHCMDNVQAAHRKCNSLKQASPPPDMDPLEALARIMVYGCRQRAIVRWPTLSQRIRAFDESQVLV